MSPMSSTWSRRGWFWYTAVNRRSATWLCRSSLYAGSNSTLSAASSPGSSENSNASMANGGAVRNTNDSGNADTLRNDNGCDCSAVGTALSCMYT